MTDIYQKAYTSIYPSRLGDILLAADEIGLTGLWFFGQSYFADTLPAEQVAQETPILAQAREWLDEYFSGKEPDFTPKLHPIGSPFRQEVWSKAGLGRCRLDHEADAEARKEVREGA